VASYSRAAVLISYPLTVGTEGSGYAGRRQCSGPHAQISRAGSLASADRPVLQGHQHTVPCVASTQFRTVRGGRSAHDRPWLRYASAGGVFYRRTLCGGSKGIFGERNDAFGGLEVLQPSADGPQVPTRTAAVV
jgi:hypothetical protein